MKYICPLITVDDINRSKDFYERMLDQKIKYDFGENVTFEGDFSIHLREHFQELIDKRPVVSGSNSFELYFEHDELEELIAKLENEKVEFVHGLREQPWRQKVVRIYDPDLNVIEIGESMEHLAVRLRNEGLSVATVAEIMNLPLNKVLSMLDQFI